MQSSACLAGAAKLERCAAILQRQSMGCPACMAARHGAYTQCCCDDELCAVARQARQVPPHGMVTRLRCDGTLRNGKEQKGTRNASAAAPRGAGQLPEDAGCAACGQCCNELQEAIRGLTGLTRNQNSSSDKPGITWAAVAATGTRTQGRGVSRSHAWSAEGAGAGAKRQGSMAKVSARPDLLLRINKHAARVMGSRELVVAMRANGTELPCCAVARCLRRPYNGVR